MTFWNPKITEDAWGNSILSEWEQTEEEKIKTAELEKKLAEITLENKEKSKKINLEKLEKLCQNTYQNLLPKKHQFDELLIFVDHLNFLLSKNKYLATREYKLEIFGSAKNGFWSKFSDIDLTLIIPSEFLINQVFF